jgi:transposase-like protein
MKKDEAPSKLLRVSEVAEQLRVNPQTAYRWIREARCLQFASGAPFACLVGWCRLGTLRRSDSPYQGKRPDGWPRDHTETTPRRRGST